MPISRCHIVEKNQVTLEDESIEITQKLKEKQWKNKKEHRRDENNVRWSNKLDDKIKSQIQEVQKTSRKIFKLLKTITMKRKSQRQLEGKSHIKYTRTKIK